jgi:hypothetical protein
MWASYIPIAMAKNGPASLFLPIYEWIAGYRMNIDINNRDVKVLLLVRQSGLTYGGLLRVNSYGSFYTFPRLRWCLIMLGSNVNLLI